MLVLMLLALLCQVLPMVPTTSAGNDPGNNNNTGLTDASGAPDSIDVGFVGADENDTRNDPGIAASSADGNNYISTYAAASAVGSNYVAGETGIPFAPGYAYSALTGSTGDPGTARNAYTAGSFNLCRSLGNSPYSRHVDMQISL